MEFKVSAPGKLILYGEHAVVYGKTAVAAALDLRTVLTFTELPASDSLIHLVLPKIHLDMYIPLLQILEYFSPEKCPKFNDNHDNYYNYIVKFVGTLECNNIQQKLALQALMYLLIAIHQNDNLIIRPFKISLETALAISSGLGSSASFAVCVSAAFLHWSCRQKNVKLTLNPDILAGISQYALNSERIMHGTPSGVDNSVCTFGGIIKFKKGAKLELMSDVKKMRVLLVNTKVARSTKNLLERVVKLKNQFSRIYDLIFDTIDNVSLEALALIEKIRDCNDVEVISDCYSKLMILIDVNQGLLATCQVSHPSLDLICAEARHFGLAGKLTGAGGGGYAYILLMPDTTDEIIDNIISKLTGYGYEVILTALGSVGVQIHD